MTRDPRQAIWGSARALSYNGSVVLGYDLAAASRLFRWRPDMSASGREMVGIYAYFTACHWREGEGLRLFWEPFTSADAVSADGTIAAGQYIDRNPRRFCIGRWFVDEGRVDCADTPPRVVWVMDMSADGRVIPGTYDAAPDDSREDLCVDDADLLRVLFAFGEAGWRPADLNLDRVVDEQDLLMVLSRFGECAN